MTQLQLEEVHHGKLELGPGSRRVFPSGFGSRCIRTRVGVLLCLVVLFAVVDSNLGAETVRENHDHDAHLDQPDPSTATATAMASGMMGAPPAQLNPSSSLSSLQHPSRASPSWSSNDMVMDKQRSTGAFGGSGRPRVEGCDRRGNVAPPMSLHKIDPSHDPGAVCLDGSTPAYYFRAGSSR